MDSEPAQVMSQMDAYKRREVIAPRLLDFVRKNRIALITITHDLKSIEGVDRIFVLHQGRLAHQGSHQELLDEKAEVYLKLLGLKPAGSDSGGDTLLSSSSSSRPPAEQSNS